MKANGISFSVVAALSLFLACPVSGQISWAQVNGLGLGAGSLALDSSGMIYATSAATGIFSSTDSGASWREINHRTDTTYHLYDNPHLCVFDGKIFLASGDGCSRSDDSGKHWTMIRPAIRSWGIKEFKGSIFLLGSTRVFRSSDWGATWDSLIVDTMGYLMEDIAFGPEDEIYVLTTRGLFLSRDSGRSWIHRQIGAQSPAVCYVNDSGIVFCCGSYPLIRSRDQGAHWDTVLHSPVRSMIKLRNEALLCLSADSLFITSDQGDSWTAFRIPGDLAVNAESCIELANHRLVIGTDNGILLTNDFGASWSYNSGSLSSGFLSLIDIRPGGPVFALGSDNGLCRSDDRGQSWRRVFTANNYTAFADNSRDIVIGGIAYVGSSSDAGVSWTPAAGNWNLKPTGIASDAAGNFYMSTVWDYGRYPSTYRSSDHGQSWDRIDDSSMSSNGNSIFVTPHGTILIGESWRGIRRSSNGGQTWAFIPCWMGEAPPVINSRNEIFTGFLRSKDDGLTWDTLPVPAQQQDIVSLAIDSLDGIYVGLDSGGILTSTDDGTTWSKFYQFSDPYYNSMHIGAIAFDGANYSWVAFGYNLFRSTAPVVHAALGVSNSAPTETGLRIRHHNQNLILETEQSGLAKIEIFSCLGIPIARFERQISSSGSYSFPLPKLIDGDYFVRAGLGSLTYYCHFPALGK